MRDDEQLSSLIGDIYDAALNPLLWVDVLGKARAFVVGLAASLYWKDATSKRGAVRFTDGGIDPYHCEQYFDKYGKLDPTATGLFFATIEEPMATADIVPYDEFVATRFYREWAQPLGLVDCVNVVLEKSVTSVAAFIVFRHLRDGMVDDETRRRTRLLVPHIRRAALIGRVIDLKTAEAATFADTLDGLAAGMFLVDADGRIVHANVSAQAMLAVGDVLRAAGDRLATNDPQTDHTLRDIFLAAGSSDAALGVKGVAMPLTARDHERPCRSRAAADLRSAASGRGELCRGRRDVRAQGGAGHALAARGHRKGVQADAERTAGAARHCQGRRCARGGRSARRR